MTVALPRIRTAIRREEAERLAELATDRTVLEVGSQRGFSTILMARTARMVHAVDWHRGDGIVGHHETLPIIAANLGKTSVRDRIVLHVGRSEDVLPVLAPGSFDFAFHDAYHSTEAVLADVALMRPLMLPGSLLAFHDYGRYGVAEAVDSLGLERLSLTGSLAVVQLP